MKHIGVVRQVCGHETALISGLRVSPSRYEKPNVCDASGFRGDMQGCAPAVVLDVHARAEIEKRGRMRCFCLAGGEMKGRHAAQITRVGVRAVVQKERCRQYVAAQYRHV